MIGIKVFTGIAPENLPIDKTTGKVVWRFSTPDKPMVQVSDDLARIIDRMIAHPSNERYSNASQILEDLYRHRDHPERTSHWWADRRVLAGCITGLLLTNVAGYGWYRHYIEGQNSIRGWQKIAQLTEQCQKPIQAQEGGTNPIDVDVVAKAEQVNQACEQALQAGQSQADRLKSLKHQGQALLLLGRSSQSLKHSKDATKYLTDAKKRFQEALKVKPQDPQIHFYLGFVSQLLGEPKSIENYNKSVDSYLKLMPANSS